MIAAAIALTASALLVALLISVIIYAVGVYIFHAPQPLVGVICLIIFLVLLLQPPY